MMAKREKFWPSSSGVAYGSPIGRLLFFCVFFFFFILFSSSFSRSVTFSVVFLQDKADLAR